MSISDIAILVFAKAPVQGEVNTRLIPAIGEEKATQLQKDLINHRLSQLTSANIADVILYCAPNTKHQYFRECKNRFSVSLKEQRGIDLGERMFNAMSEEAKHYQTIILVGTDAPALDVVQIEESILKLNDGADIVLVPASDGGYVLIGMKEINKSVFLTVPWGTDRVLVKTRANCVAAALNLVELGECWDIDRPEDYERALHDASFPPWRR